MAKKPYRHPTCCAPYCELEAEIDLRLSGENGHFVGKLCFDHADAMTAAFPAVMVGKVLLRAISVEAMQARMAEVFTKEHARDV